MPHAPPSPASVSNAPSRVELPLEQTERDEEGSPYRTPLHEPGGYEAVNLRVAEQYIGEFGNLAREGNTLILPTNLADIGGMVAAATSVIKKTREGAA